VSGDLAAWLRERITERKALAEAVLAIGVSPEWSEMSSGVLNIGDYDPADHWAGVFPVGDSRLTRFAAANDPRSVIARCEAEVAILDEHEPVSGYDPNGLVCGTCGESPRSGDEPGVVRWPCRTVRLLGSAYRFEAGHQEGWAP
jgi:uncharacterized protein DUF6221